jgi:predicted TIM-barrel fold metal-dependent hydrolase
MIIDAHLHCTGRETASDVLRSLDEARIDHAVLLAPFVSEGYSLDDPASLRRGNAHLGALVRGHPDRLTGFAVVNPSDPQAPADLRRAIESDGLRGVKMVPTGWYPYEAAVQPTFAVAGALQLPMLFHSGIFIDGRSGRFCRPVFFEALRDHPGVRVALAHLGWPWTDEAIAVGLIDRIHGIPPADAVFRFDISFGPPPPYRLEVLRRAIDVLGVEGLQFGSDCFLPCPGHDIAERIRWVAELMDALGLDAGQRERIWSRTAADWLRLPGTGRQPQPAAHLAGGTSNATPPLAPPADAGPEVSPREQRVPAWPSLHRRPGSSWLVAGSRISPRCC